MAIPLADLVGTLRNYRKSHCAALRIAAESMAPPPNIRDAADRRIRALLEGRRRGDIDLGANMQELREIALRAASQKLTTKAGTAIYRAGSAAIRRYVLKRADGKCEGCGAPAPFLDSDGQPFLEAHHTTRKADDGPDHLRKVIGLCPNCHRKAHLAQEHETFNKLLVRKLRALEAAG